MKVLLYSHAFSPSTGGVETVSMQLAEGFTRHGLECKVVTQTPRETGKTFVFELIDRPDSRRVRELVGWADVVLFNGASLALQPWLLLSRKPFIWVHVGYQTACIDGAGWFDGAPAPLTPWASVRYHAKRRGWARVWRDALKLALRRFVATQLVDTNVAITGWMERANPLPRQIHIYNPFPTDRYAAAASHEGPTPEFEFLYLGRLVSEKGIDTLLRAFAQIVARRASAPPRLLIIGDGDRRAALEALARELGVAPRVVFAGNQRGDALIDWVCKGRIAVIPSAWYEPMGGVVVELMAAGRNLIVSRDGGLAECMGDAGLSFANGDADALAKCMLELLDDPALRASQSARAKARALEFAPGRFIDQYVALLERTTRKRPGDSA
jgi:glycosyltransferase involved in cell wall biosynthesis